MECHREIGCPEEELRTVLSRHLDGDLAGPEAEAVEDHLKECPRCRDELASLRGVDRTVRRSVEETRASTGFVRRVMSAISGRRRGARLGGRAVPRWVVWGLATLVAAGAAALVWVVVAWLVAEPPRPLRELRALTFPDALPWLEGSPSPRWRTRRIGERRWTDLERGAAIAAGAELELDAAGGHGLVIGMVWEMFSSPGTRFVVGPDATDVTGFSLVSGRALVARPGKVDAFDLGLFDPSRSRRAGDLPGHALTLAGAASSVLVEVHGEVAVVTAVSGRVTLSWATGAREIAAGEQTEVTDAQGARGAARVDLRALDLSFARPRLRVSPWPQLGGSAAREGCSPFEFALPPREILRVGVVPGGAAPVIGPDGTAYLLVGPAPGMLVGVRRGKVAASVALEEPSVGAPALAPDGSVVVATRGGVVRAPADLARFDTVLRLELDDIPRTGPTVSAGGDLYVVLGRGLAAFGPDGRPLWRRDDVRSGSPPSLSPDGTVHVAAISGKLHALDPATGEDRAPASTPVDEPFLAPVAVAPDGTAYAVSASRYLAWRAADGTTGRAALPVSEYVLAPAIAPSGEVLVASAGGVVHRLPPRAKEAPARAFFEAGERIVRGPLVDGAGRIALWTESGKLTVVEATGLSSSWELGGSEGPPGAVSGEGVLFFVTSDGRVFGR